MLCHWILLRSVRCGDLDRNTLVAEETSEFFGVEFTTTIKEDSFDCGGMMVCNFMMLFQKVLKSLRFGW